MQPRRGQSDPIPTFGFGIYYEQPVLGAAAAEVQVRDDDVSDDDETEQEPGFPPEDLDDLAPEP